MNQSIGTIQRCTKCGERNHIAENCTLKTCNFCNKIGHTEEVCRLKNNRVNFQSFRSTPQNSQKKCFNCGDPSHYKNDCTAPLKSIIKRKCDN